MVDMFQGVHEFLVLDLKEAYESEEFRIGYTGKV
jgi:hypothetical protein